MFKMVNKRLRNRKGFTLIELVVVVAILGILALIAIPRFADVRNNAAEQSLESTAVSILNAAEVAYIDDPTATGLDLPTSASGNETKVGGTADIAGLVAADYLRAADYTDFDLVYVEDGKYKVVSNVAVGDYAVDDTIVE